MASFAFQKFRSLENRSSSTSRAGAASNPGNSRRTSDTPSTNSSSSNSLQQPPLKKAKGETLASSVKDRQKISSKTKQQILDQEHVISTPPDGNINTAMTEPYVNNDKGIKQMQNVEQKGESAKNSNLSDNKDAVKTNQRHSANMSDLRAQFFQETYSQIQKQVGNQTQNMPEIPRENDTPKSTLQKSNFTNEEKSMRSNSMKTKKEKAAENSILAAKDALAVTKGQASDIKSMFEENIAVKKGKIPDPTIPQGPKVKMRRKVNPNLKVPAMFKDLPEQTSLTPQQQLAKNRESIPIDKKTFNRFLSKFEDERYILTCHILF